MNICRANYTDPETKQVLENVLIYVQQVAADRTIDILCGNLMGNSSRVAGLEEILSIEYKVIGGVILPVVKEIKEPDAIEGDVELKEQLFSLISEKIKEEEAYSYSKELENIRTYYDANIATYKVPFSKIKLAINSMLYYIDKCKTKQKPSIELVEALTTPEVKSAYDEHMKFVVDLKSKSGANKPPAKMRYCTDKIYFPLHSLEDILEKNYLEELDLPTYINPYPNRMLAHPEKWLDLARDPKYETIVVAGSPANNNLGLQENESQFMAEFDELIDEFKNHLRDKYKVTLTESKDLKECVRLAPRETNALLEYFRMWLSGALLMNWAHVGKLVVPLEFAGTLNTFDYIASEEYAQDLRNKYNKAEDDVYTDSDDEELDMIILLSGEDKGNPSNLQRVVFIDNQLNFIQNYIEKADKLRAYPEAIIKLARWGERKPTKLKLNDLDSYYSLATFSNDTQSGCMEDYTRVAFSEDGTKTKVLYAIVSNQCSASLPLDSDFFKRNDYVQEDIPMGVVVAEYLAETGGVNLIFIDFLTFVDNFKSLNIAGLRLDAGGMIEVDNKEWEFVNKKMEELKIKRDLGEAIYSEFRAVSELELKNKAKNLNMPIANIKNVVQTEEFFSGIGMDINLATTLLRKVKSLKDGEAHVVNYVPTTRTVSRPVLVKEARLFVEDEEVEFKGTIEELAAYVDQLQSSGIKASYYEESKPKEDAEGNPIYNTYTEDFINPLDIFLTLYSCKYISGGRVSAGLVTIGGSNMFTALDAYLHFDQLDTLLSLDLKAVDARTKLENTGLTRTPSDFYRVEQMVNVRDIFHLLATKFRNEDTRTNINKIFTTWAQIRNEVLSGSANKNINIVKQTTMSKPKVNEAFVWSHQGIPFAYVTVEPETKRKIFYNTGEVIVDKVRTNDSLTVKTFCSFAVAYYTKKELFDAKAKENTEGQSMGNIVEDLNKIASNDPYVKALNTKLGEVR